MDTAQSQITPVQKVIALVLVLSFLGLVSYYITTQTDLLRTLFRNTKNTIYAVETPPRYAVTIHCDVSDPACFETVTILRNLQIERSQEMSLTYRHNIDLQQSSSVIASVAVEIAGDYDKFWEMLFFLYDYQYEWLAATDISAAIADYAASLEIDKEDFIKKLTKGTTENSKYYKRVRKDVTYAQDNDIPHGPVVFTNGNRIDTPVTYELFGDETEQ